LAFDQVGCQGAAVDREKRLVMAGRRADDIAFQVVVHGAGTFPDPDGDAQRGAFLGSGDPLAQSVLEPLKAGRLPVHLPYVSHAAVRCWVSAARPKTSSVLCSSTAARACP